MVVLQSHRFGWWSCSLIYSATDPLSTALVTSPFFKELGRLTSKTLDGCLVSDKQSLAKAWADCLYTKVDGKGLSEARSIVEASRWVSNPPRNQSGQLHQSH